MSSSYSAGPIFSKRTQLIRWGLFALVAAVLTAQSVVAVPIHSVKQHEHGHHLLPGSHNLFVRGDSKQDGKEELHKLEKDVKEPKLGKDPAFDGLGVFSDLPAKPRWGLETGSKKLHDKNEKKHKQSSSSDSSPTKAPTNSHEFVHENQDKKMDGAASVDLDKILGHAIGGALHVSGGLEVEYSSNSEKLRTVIPTKSLGSSISLPTPSSSSHDKSKHYGQKAAQTTGSNGSSSEVAPGTNESTPDTSSPGHKESGSRQFYRIGVAEGSVPEPILSEIQEESETGSDGRVAAVSSANEPGGNLRNQSVITNNPNYGFLDAQDDLYAIRKWAQDLDQLVSKENRNETLMALFNAASRYYPDVDTKVVVRIMLADIKAESDFVSDNASPGRLDSGQSLGLVQVSPYGSGELDQFKKSAMTKKNTYSWTAGKGADHEVEHGGTSVLGALHDFSTGKAINVNSLSAKDLSRPWINIHVAMWLQSNHARTGSQDPWRWPQVSSASKDVRTAYQPALREILGTSSSSQAGSGSNAESHGNASADASAKSSSSASAHAFSVDSYGTSLTALEKMLKGKNAQKVSFATALGSWVAGPSEDDGGYMTAGDDISAQYFAHIAEGLSVMYTGSTAQKHKYGKDWLDSIELTPGLVDYAK